MKFLLNKIKIRYFCVACSHKAMGLKYPEIEKDDTIVDDYFGTKIPDPFRWLENPDSEETKAFVDAQNSITRPFLDNCEYKSKLSEKITQFLNYPKFSVPFKQGNKYYQYRNSGLQNQSVIYELGDVPKVLLDPNAFSEDGTVALSGTAFSEDGSTLAYGISTSGSDWIQIKFLDTKTGNHYNEILNNAKFSSMAWMHDNFGFFYGAYLDQSSKSDGSATVSSENHKLYYHALGTDQSEDVIAVDFDDSKLRIYAKVSHCGNYLVITPTNGCKNNLLFVAELKSKTKLDLNPIVTEFIADFNYIFNLDRKFIFRTNKDAENYRIVVIDIENSEEYDLIPEHPRNVLDWARVINENFLIVCYLKNVKHILRIHELKSGRKIYDFNLELGTISSISGKWYHKEMFYSFCSFLTPNIIYKVNFEEDEIIENVYHETKVGDFDSSLYKAKQVFYKSKDGTKIPMFLVSKKTLIKDGSNPCLLYGYGGFNIKLTPSFSVYRLIFIKHFNGIFALANIRGGGEYGDKWHNAGRFEKKQNCFDDFQYAAHFLLEQNYTNEKKLIIQGGSNGGLLVAACINQAPHLFGAAICEVGVLDMLRYHKFTIGYAWKSDYGCSDEEEEFNYLYKYSPLHNISIPENGGVYPATLLLTADHDDRVVPLHSLKFIAQLQEKIGRLESQNNPLLVRIETRAGHGAGKPTSKIIDEITDIFCFISRALNLIVLN